MRVTFRISGGGSSEIKFQELRLGAREIGLHPGQSRAGGAGLETRRLAVRLVRRCIVANGAGLRACRECWLKRRMAVKGWPPRRGAPTWLAGRADSPRRPRYYEAHQRKTATATID